MNMNPTPPCDSVGPHNQFPRQTSDTDKQKNTPAQIKRHSFWSYWHHMVHTCSLKACSSLLKCPPNKQLQISWIQIVIRQIPASIWITALPHRHFYRLQSNLQNKTGLTSCLHGMCHAKKPDNNHACMYELQKMWRS
jgi:hypothetical protein